LQKLFIIKTKDLQLLHDLFPSELTNHFSISYHEILCSLETREEYWVIEFEEKNDLPEGYSATVYESKGFMESKLIQDFPLRGRAVYLRVKKRRWRHKETGAIIKRDFSFIADGSKFTQELSDFLKEAGGYATRYHEKHSQLLWGQRPQVTTPLQA
jgi:hypothetical protein